MPETKGRSTPQNSVDLIVTLHFESTVMAGHGASKDARERAGVPAIHVFLRAA
jgi:hypothetical protein